MKAEITILGCGNSTGVPAIGNHWGLCDPNEPNNNRTRCSIAVQTEATTLIVDTGPDFSAQLTRERISHIDGVLYTHMHSDHVGGIDELRIIRFRNKALVPIYADQATMADLKSRFPYLFDGGNSALYPPILEPHILKAEHFGTARSFGDILYVPFAQDHGSCESVGYRFGDFGYSVDILDLDARGIETLKGIKIWVVDAAAYHQSDNSVHANLETIFRLNKSIGAAQVYLTSLTLSMDYQTLVKELPQGYAPAYDGLRLDINLD
jgi:phosphoribosyl 1,2-cyclic phosphate phosphodiesterase